MILVTGGSGLLGAELIKQLLKNGETVKAIYNRTPLPAFHDANLSIEHCDILDVVRLEEIMQGVHAIYHCAGLVSFSQRDVQKLYKINVEGTANIVNAALDAGVKKLLHVSSVAALGRLRIHEPIDEEMKWTPETSNSRYGESKHLGEMEVWRGVAEGLDAIVINPTIILGPGNWDEGSTRIFKSVYDGFPWYSNGTTGFVDVRDAASIMIRLMNSDVSGQRFIVSGFNETYRHVFELIADAFDKRRPHREVTPFIAKLVTISEAIKSKVTGKDPLVTKETAKTAITRASFNNHKLLNTLADFTYTPLEETISYTCAALQQKVNNQ